MAPRPTKNNTVVQNKTSNGNKERVLALKCKWKKCDEILALPSDGYETFSEHVSQHIKEYLENLSESSGAVVGLGAADYDDKFSLVPMQCGWFECQWEVRGNVGEFMRHVLFHAYHSKLKCLGAFVVIAEKLRQCSFDVETQDLLPDLSDPFLCRWESCGQEFYCPDQFYRHVGLHGHGAHREDVLVTTGEKYKTAAGDEELEGLAVQTMMQSVCRWEGCSYLARDPWKIKEHCRTHTGERQIACPSCGMFFANKTKLADHLIRQDAKQYENFQCSHCLKRCASERLLRDHMRHHVNHVKCPHCDMTCPNPSALRSHLRFKHSLDRPFQCSMCEFSCKTRQDIQRHEEIHFERRFPCEVEGCIYHGKTVAGLRAHVKAVHERSGSRQFMCHICEKTLSRGYLLTKHLKKAHHFSWPSGHSRFRYKLDEDGYYRLQMVRFESAELTEEMSGESPELEDIYDVLQGHETAPIEARVTNDPEILGNFSPTEVVHAQSPASSMVSNSCESESVVPVREDNPNIVQVSEVSMAISDCYEALLQVYEMARDGENSHLDSSVATENIDESYSLGKPLQVKANKILQNVPTENKQTMNMKRKQLESKKSVSKRLKIS